MPLVESLLTMAPSSQPQPQYDLSRGEKEAVHCAPTQGLHVSDTKGCSLSTRQRGRMSLDRTRRKWYRAPELLMGETNYTGAIDMWAVGCLKAELVLLKVLFPGNSEIEQLSYIHLTLGPTLQMMLSVSAPKLEWIF
ncbi:hypothetical protein SASPL_125043 [Salvia splendens]|uniref:Protein kinase domain-containing protein n=1 Tax=Salvia splendens TaxID=180675 RepID=A0A8X8XJ75_SALSN|nr:hypothetical protein SASPL_125043 [Salvia splendens]